MDKKIFGIMMILAVMACFMVGCGKDNVAEELGQLDRAVETGQGDSQALKELSSLEEKLGVPAEGLDYTIELGSFRYIVKADVEVSAPEKVAVYQEELVNLTEEKVNALAKEVFDGGSYEAKKPYAAYSLSELQLEKKELEDQLLVAKFEYAEDEWLLKDKLADVSFYVDHYIEPKTAFEAGKYFDCQYYGEAKTDKELEGYLLYFSRIMILEGKINGDVYQMVAYQTDAEYGGQKDSCLKLYRESENWSQSNAQVRGYYYGVDPASIGGAENECTYSEEEAGRLAEDIMDRLGFGEMEIVRTEALYFQRTPSDTAFQREEVDNTEENIYYPQMVVDGYVFYLQRAYQGLAGMDIPAGWEWLSADGDSYAEQECYEVFVSSEGVISLVTGVLYENKKMTTDDVKLQNFEKIDTLARNALKAEAEKKGNINTESEGASDGVSAQTSGGVTICKVALKYLNLQYNGEFLLMPVWVYYYKGEQGSMLYPAVLINAVNGGIIKDNDDVYKCIS